MLGFEGDNAREKVIVLLTMCFALAMAMLDNTVVNVALPSIAKDLGAGVSGLQWIVDAYVLAFASLLLTGGILGDKYGRKKMLLCGLSHSTSQLVTFRFFQGIGGALLIPGTLSIITVTFPPQERAKAIGLWAGVSGIALALGPTLGGVMVQHIGWQSVFFLNVPIGIIAFLVGVRTITESRSEEARQLDVLGLVLSTAALFSVTYGLIEANQRGWSDPLIITSFVAFAILITAFLMWEIRNPHAMMPLKFFRIPAFSAGNFTAFSVALGMFATFFFLSLYMQLPVLRDYSPEKAGAAFLPMTLMIVFTAPNAGRYASQHGSRGPMTYGLLLAGGGLLVLGLFLEPTTPYFPWLFVVFAIMGHGMGATMAPMTAAVMNSVGPQRAGLGSAMTNTSREVGGVLGIALLGTILTTRLKSVITPALAALSLSPAQQTTISTAAGHGQLDLSGLTPAQAAGASKAFADAYMTGFHTAMLFAGTVLMIAAFIANRFIPGREGIAEHHAAAEAAEAPVAVEVEVEA
jgi:EmrB/QacA subfamily drug resistance transporter